MENNKGINKKQLIFYLGVLSIIIGLICVPSRFNMSLVCIIISIMCFCYSKEELKKIFLNPILKYIVVEKKRKKKLIDEIAELNNKKKSIEQYINDKEQYVLDLKKQTEEIKMLSNKRNSIKKEIEILEIEKNNLNTAVRQKEELENRIIEKREELKTLTIEKVKLTNIKIQLEEGITKIKEVEQFKRMASIEYINNLDGIEFEKFIQTLLKYLDFDESYVTKESGDYGIDVIGIKNNIRYGIQCKNYNGPVGNRAIQEAYSGKDYYDCNVAIVVTNNHFTSNAIHQANKNKVVLWDKDDIIKIIDSIR